MKNLKIGKFTGKQVVPDNEATTLEKGDPVRTPHDPSPPVDGVIHYIYPCGRFARVKKTLGGEKFKNTIVNEYLVKDLVKGEKFERSR